MADTTILRDAHGRRVFVSPGDQTPTAAKVKRQSRREARDEKNRKAQAHLNGGPEWFEGFHQHLDENLESALRMAGDQEGADKVRDLRQTEERAQRERFDEEQRAASRAHNATARLSLFGQLDFSTGRELRESMDKVRRNLVLGSTELAIVAEVVEELLAEVAIVKQTKLGHIVPKAVRRRRARKVSKPIANAAECLRHAAAQASAAPAALNREYAPEMEARGKSAPGRPTFEF
jgi:hypothetical protein